VSAWKKTGSCSKSCGTGTSTYTRSVLYRAGLGGRSCPPLRESRLCNLHKCPVDCKLSKSFGPWGSCSRTCGGGARVRSRTVVTAAAYGGKKCQAALKTQSKTCDPRSFKYTHANTSNAHTRNTDILTSVSLTCASGYCTTERSSDWASQETSTTNAHGTKRITSVSAAAFRTNST
jgi:hypothetical protein